MSELPRRRDMLRWTRAEHAVHRAIRAVELTGADLRLTDAVLLLQAALDSVADYVDGVESRRSAVDFDRLAALEQSEADLAALRQRHAAEVEKAERAVIDWMWTEDPLCDNADETWTAWLASEAKARLT